MPFLPLPPLVMRCGLGVGPESRALGVFPWPLLLLKNCFVVTTWFPVHTYVPVIFLPNPHHALAYVFPTGASALRVRTFLLLLYLLHIICAWTFEYISHFHTPEVVTWFSPSSSAERPAGEVVLVSQFPLSFVLRILSLLLSGVSLLPSSCLLPVLASSNSLG